MKARVSSGLTKSRWMQISAFNGKWKGDCRSCCKMVRRDEIAAKIDRIADGLAEIKMDQFSGSLPANQPGKQTDYCGSGPHRGLPLFMFSPQDIRTATPNPSRYDHRLSPSWTIIITECIDSVNTSSYDTTKRKTLQERFIRCLNSQKRKLSKFCIQNNIWLSTY